MKFGEKLQYKIRNYLYDIDRSKKQRQTGKKTTKQQGEDGSANQLLQALDEMDEYLGELFENLPHKKDNKRKN